MEQTLLLAPLAGAIVAGLGWRLIGEKAARWTASFLMVIAAALAWLIALSVPEAPGTRYLYTWIESGSLSAALAFRVDQNAALLLGLVTSLSALAHLVALTRPLKPQETSGTKTSGTNRYVPGQEARLCAGLGLMTAAMILLIAADDLAQFLAGWIATGVACTLLSGLVVRKPASGKAALRIALTLRAGEAALFLVVGLVFALTDAVRFDDLFQALPDLDQTAVPAFALDWPRSAPPRGPARSRS